MSSSSQCRILVLISGSGTNLQSIIDNNDNSKSTIVGVISNKPKAYGLIRAHNHEIDTSCVILKPDESREEYDQRLLQKVAKYKPDLIVLAGFMRILTAEFVLKYQGKILNIHPSLLPKYTGLDTHQRAIDNKDIEHGTSVHFVTPQLDAGPIILQAKVPVYKEDTVQILTERVQEQEYRIYPLVIKWFVQGRLKMEQNIAYLDNNPIGNEGYAPD